MIFIVGSIVTDNGSISGQANNDNFIIINIRLFHSLETLL